MHLASALKLSLLAASVSAYTEVTQWTGYNCGVGGYRTSYLWIDGSDTYIDRDQDALSIYIEQYDERPPTFFFSGPEGSGYEGREVWQSYCYIWDQEEAFSIANPPYGEGYRRATRSAGMTPGQPVEIDDTHQGLGHSRQNSTETAAAP